MKKIICMLLLGCMLFSMSACNIPAKNNTPDHLPQEFDTAPAINGLTVTVNGRSLSEVYKEGETYYVCLGELLAILGGKLATDAAIAEPYTATIKLEKSTYTISNTETVLKEKDAASHPLVFEPIYDGEDWYVPMEPIMSLFDLHLLEDGENNQRYYTYFPTKEDVATGKKIPILMYHAVSDEPWGIAELFVSPGELEKQLKYLQDNGYTTITFEDFDRLDSIEKPVMLTFDDGYDDNYTQLFPLLKKYKAKATVFVITGEIGKQYYLTEKQIKEMNDSGLVSIQSHTVTHPYLSDLSAEQLEKEFTLSKLTLTRITGKEPFVLCYPTGKYSDLSLEKTAKHFSFGLLMNGGMYTTGTQDIYQIPRFYISRNTDIYTYAAKLR